MLRSENQGAKITQVRGPGRQLKLRPSLSLSTTAIYNYTKVPIKTKEATYALNLWINKSSSLSVDSHLADQEILTSLEDTMETQTVCSTCLELPIHPVSPYSLQTLDSLLHLPYASHPSLSFSLSFSFLLSLFLSFSVSLSLSLSIYLSIYPFFFL